jgi:hypothetical protein
MYYGNSVSIARHVRLYILLTVMIGPECIRTSLVQLNVTVEPARATALRSGDLEFGWPSTFSFSSLYRNLGTLTSQSRVRKVGDWVECSKHDIV